MERVTIIDDDRARVEPMECPKCGSTNTRIVDKVQLVCINCGAFSNPNESPSVIRAKEKLAKRCYKTEYYVTYKRGYDGGRYQTHGVHSANEVQQLIERLRHEEAREIETWMCITLEQPIDMGVIFLPPGEPCSKTCASHITKPCDKCGRIAAGSLKNTIEKGGTNK